MTPPLAHKKCIPCENGGEPLSDSQEEVYLSAVGGWQIERDGVHRLQKEIKLKNFEEVLDLVAKIGEIAESEGHHPNLYLHDYKFLRVELTTHAVKGLSANDFILAAKIDELLGALPKA